MQSHEEYLNLLLGQCNQEYAIATEARSQGHDPRIEVEIPQAHDLAQRTQQLLEFLHPRNTAEQIRELTEEHDGNREMVALDLALIVCAETLLYGKSRNCKTCTGTGEVKEGEWRKRECNTCSGKGVIIEYRDEIKTNTKSEVLAEFEATDKSKWKPKQIAMAIYHGICAGLAVLTEGILVAPLEGVVSARILTNADDTNCLAVNFAGPIRSAGGTGQALSVLIADILRRKFNIGVSQVTSNEVERYKEEVGTYGRGLQYRPSNPELGIIAKNCPIYLDGEGVGNEVTGQRDLPRVPTNKVREGCLLVMCEGLVLKAPKILKYVEALELDGWDWLHKFVKSSKGASGERKIQSSDKYISDVLAGRPIFSQPMRQGGFRLRYGRSRLGGLATTSVHPATMQALSGFIIIGTQMKYERPGKATVVTPCNDIEGPYIEFKDGSAKRIQHMLDIPTGLPTDVDWPIAKIWDLGELLVPVGEFIENNHPLAPSGYVSDWHNQVLEQKSMKPPETFREAVEQAKNGVPLHPNYVANWNDITAKQTYDLLKAVEVDVCAGTIKIPNEYRDIIYQLNIDITEDGVLEGDLSYLILFILKNLKDPSSENFNCGIDFLNWILPFEIKSRIGIRIGARMGKPEGSKHREMKPAIHTMHPLGFNVGAQRLVDQAAKDDSEVQVGIRWDAITGEEVTTGVSSGENTDYMQMGYRNLGLKEKWQSVKEQLRMFDDVGVKGVKGMLSKERLPENLLKGALRYKHDLSTFRDGTIRFDAVDVTMTHFKPCEIGLTAEKARQLGYDCESENSVVELRCQDIIIPLNCADKFLKVTQYVDELLQQMYGLDPYYNCKEISDLFGHMAMGIAPHTSGAILCRIIGVAEIKGHYGHPYFHAAKRRNCDGDIDSILLLLDGLLNFSRLFLPGNRGGLMDAPLILTTRIDPSEIDKEAHNVDINWKYPVEFYELTQSIPDAKEAISKGGIITVAQVLGTPAEYSGFGYTHETDDANEGPKNNPYNTLESMREKTKAQFALGELLVCVDNTDQSSRLIDRHLLRDMRGNLRAFGQQKVRCTKCGESYRRPPLSGNCTTILEEKLNPFTKERELIHCPGNIILTVTKGSVMKYDKLMTELIDEYGCNEYTEAVYHLVKNWASETLEDPNEKKPIGLW
jgi:DNA polymerase II large subunit